MVCQELLQINKKSKRKAKTELAFQKKLKGQQIHEDVFEVINNQGNTVFFKAMKYIISIRWAKLRSWVMPTVREFEVKEETGMFVPLGGKGH